MPRPPTNNETSKPGEPVRPGRPRNLAEEIGKRDPFDCPEQEAYLNLVRTTEVYKAEFDLLFKNAGLSQPLYNALRIVRGSGPDGVPSRKIADDLISRDPDVTRLIDRLQEKGFVTRHRSEHDRRVIRVKCTPAGRKLLTKLDPKVVDLHRQQLGHLGAENLTRLSAILHDARHPG